MERIHILKVKSLKIWKINRMPFGLSNAPGTFVEHWGWSWESVVSFLDDIVILGRGFEDHMMHMEQVLSWFRDFKLKPSKCELLKRDIIFYGSQGKQGVLIQEKLRKWKSGQR